MIGQKAFENYFTGVFSSLAKELDDWVESFDPLGFSKRYRSVLSRRHASIKILGMSRPASISSIYIDVYVHEDIPARLFLDPKDLEKLFSDHDFSDWSHFGLGRVSALSFIKRSRKALFLGKPGSGKTTLFRHLVCRLLSDKTPFRALPFYVTLREFADSPQESLLDFITNDLDRYCDFPSRNAAPFLERLFSRGDAALFLDGLDEVAVSKRDPIVREIEKTIARFSESWILISCRTADYHGWFANLPEVELADFTREQATKFIRRWFRRAPTRANLLIQAYTTNHHIRELCSTPLLAALLCILFQYNLKLPESRAELYSECIDALLYKWDANRLIARPSTYSQLSTARKRNLFAEIANNFMEKQLVFIPEKTLIDTLKKAISRLGIDDAEGVLQEIAGHHALLLERSAGVWSFMHLTFQEYFAALWIAQNRIEHEVVRHHFEDPRWRETILMVVGILPDPESLIKQEVALLLKNERFGRLGPYLTRLLRIGGRGLGLKECKDFIESDMEVIDRTAPGKAGEKKIQQIKAFRSLERGLGLFDYLPKSLKSKCETLQSEQLTPWSADEVCAIAASLGDRTFDDFWEDVDKVRLLLSLVKESCDQSSLSQPILEDAVAPILRGVL